MGYAPAMKLFSIALAFAVAGCGGATNPVPTTSPTTTSAPTPAHVEPEPVATAAEVAPPPAPTPPPAEAKAETCDAGWVCVKVNLATGKVEKRETKLMGDPKIESTWSKQSDGRTVSFDDFSKGPVELTLRRKPGNKNDVVVKLAKGGQTVVIDKRDGTIEDFTHVGVIATEQDGALLIDMRYMR